MKDIALYHNEQKYQKGDYDSKKFTSRQEFLLLNPSELTINLSQPSLSIKWDKYLLHRVAERTELKVKCLELGLIHSRRSITTIY